jgi:hypothetical protein
MHSVGLGVLFKMCYCFICTKVVSKQSFTACLCKNTTPQCFKFRCNARFIRCTCSRSTCSSSSGSVCDAMRSDAMRCNAMRFDTMPCTIHASIQSSPKDVEDPVGRPPPRHEDRQAVDDEQNIGLGEGQKGHHRQQHRTEGLVGAAAFCCHCHGGLELAQPGGGAVGRALACDAKETLQGRNVPDQPVRPGRQARQQQRRRQPRLDGLGQGLVGPAVRRVVEHKGLVEPPGDQPAGAQGDTGRSLRAQERPPVVEEGFPGADLQGPVDGGVRERDVRVGRQVDPDGVLEVDNVLQRINLFDGLRDGHAGVVEEARDDRVVNGVGRKGVQKENGNVARHDELVFRRRGEFEKAILEFFGKVRSAVVIDIVNDIAVIVRGNVRPVHGSFRVVGFGLPGISDGPELVFEIISLSGSERCSCNSFFP